MPLHPVLAEKLSTTLASTVGSPFTKRDARLLAIPGNVHSVIGMRRAGKTTFLRQLQAERRATLPPERALFLGFDDERLAGIGVEQLGFLLEELFRRHPTQPDTLARELGALREASRAHPRAARRLLVLDRDALVTSPTPGIEVLPAYEWLLTRSD